MPTFFKTIILVATYSHCWQVPAVSHDIFNLTERPARQLAALAPGGEHRAHVGVVDDPVRVHVIGAVRVRRHLGRCPAPRGVHRGEVAAAHREVAVEALLARRRSIEGAPESRRLPGEPAVLTIRRRQMAARRSRKRRGGDSNPRAPEGTTGFRDQRIQPLCHLSERERHYTGSRRGRPAPSARPGTQQPPPNAGRPAAARCVTESREGRDQRRRRVATTARPARPIAPDIGSGMIGGGPSSISPMKRKSRVPEPSPAASASHPRPTQKPSPASE